MQKLVTSQTKAIARCTISIAQFAHLGLNNADFKSWMVDTRNQHHDLSAAKSTSHHKGVLPGAKGLIDLRGRGFLQERGQISESKMVNVVHQLWIVSGKATAPFSLSWRDKLATERSSTSDVELFRTFLRLSRCQQSQNLFHVVFPGAG